MTAEIISIGDELLIGQVINSNQAYIGERLHAIGISVDTMTSVGDDLQKICAALEQSLSRHDVVIVTGGLGPTHDDVTRSAMCQFFQTDLVEDASALVNIVQKFAARRIELLEVNRQQALVPRGCTPIQNALGTAPGYWFERDGKYCAVLPGVPYEMKGMMDSFVIPELLKKNEGTVIAHRTLKTTGIAESLLAHRLGPPEDLFKGISGLSLAYLPNPLGVRLRITARARLHEDANRALSNAEKKLRAVAEKYIYGVDHEELEDVVGSMLVERGLRLAVAESCTGGLIADRITDASGSSRYFERGLVTYSNESKRFELGVPATLLDRHGAVSREVAEAMAFGVRTKCNTDIGLSTTGIAGPTGGTQEKPVGLIWIGYSDAAETLALRFDFGSDRRRFKERAAQAALELLRRRLLRIE
ncbi:MAG: competence/damage-inducible protein A [Ignavibacteria bacterium]|nr:competence/damage-inducible protein A [Ignavibacteria bacterium]